MGAIQKIFYDTELLRLVMIFLSKILAGSDLELLDTFCIFYSTQNLELKTIV
jgi:hypothetical protein